MSNLTPQGESPSARQAIFEAAPFGLLGVDGQGRIREVNPAAASLLGQSQADLLACSLSASLGPLLRTDGAVLAPEEAPGALTLRTREAVYHQTVGLVREDGNTLWLELSAVPQPDGGVLLCLSDITQHHLTETILAARARLAEMAPSASLEQVLRATLDEAEHLTGSCIGFFHFMEADQKTLTLQAWSTRTEDEFCRAEGRFQHYPVDQAGVWVDAVHARKPVIHNDYASLPHRKGMPEGHAKVTRELVVPVLRDNQIVALVGVGNKPFPYGDRDLQTVQRLADLSWDIAERKRSEAALRQSELDYRTQFLSMRQGAFRQDAEGRVIDVNPAALEIFGLTREEFLERDSFSPAWDVVGEDGQPLPGDQHPSMVALRTGEQVLRKVVGVVNHRTRTRVWVEVNAVPEFRPTDPKPYRVMATIHDLTERHQLEARLRESEARWQAVVEQAGDGFELLDEEGRYLQVNEASCQALGYTREELLQLTVFDIDPLVSKEVFQDRLMGLVDQPAITFETRHRRKNGTTFPAEVTTSVIRLDGGLRALAQVRDLTQRHASEHALRVNELRLRQAVHVARLGIWEWDPRTDRTEWFGEMFRIYGIQPETFTGRGSDYLSYTRADFRDLQQRNMKAAWANAVTEAQFLAGEAALGDLKELCIVRPDGTEVFTLGGAICIVDEEGQPSLMRGITLDITARKAAEAALRDALGFNETLLATMPMGAAVFQGSTGQCVMTNQALADFLGTTIDRILAMHFRTIPSWQSSGMLEVAERVLATGRNEHLEVHATASSGVKVWLSCEFSSFSTEEGPNLLVLALDISKRKQSELGLLESEQKFRGLFDSMKEGFALHEIITDAQGVPVDYRFLDVNPAFEELTGIPKDRWIGRTVREVLPGTEPRWIKEFGEVALTGRPTTFEEESKDLGRFFRVKAYRPAARQFAVLVTDITDRIRMERERRHLEAQMAQAQKMESLGSLAGGVAHDMNNVLGAIMSLASIHHDQAEANSRLHKSMSTILKACTRGRTLVKGLLGFARQSLEEVRSLNLNEVVREEVSLLERTIHTSISIQTELAPDLLPMAGDLGSLSHALMNLCLNAVDAMPEGGTLTLRTRNLGPDRISLEVQDTGIGMSKEILAKAQDPFFTTKPQGKGTGLGLAIVYGCVKAHHGQMAMSSTPSVGTCVELQFPVAVGPTAEVVAAGPAQVPTRSLKVLVVDDDELMQESLGVLLISLGHLPVMTCSGEDALERLRQDLHVDLVILDLNMPGLGGAETLPRLRESHPALPVLIATGRADQTAMDLVRRTPYTQLLPKPFSTQEVVHQIQQFGLA